MIMGRDIIRRVDLDGETFEDYDGEEDEDLEISSFYDEMELLSQSYLW